MIENQKSDMSAFVMEGTSFIVPYGQTQAPARAYVCIPVAESMGKRSPVMEILMDCEGVVELPAGVEASDLQTWAEIQPEAASKLTTQQLAQALKVSHVEAYPHLAYYAAPDI